MRFANPKSGRFRRVLAPVLMVVPFIGTAFVGDQRRYIYMFTNETGGDPWPLIERTLDRVDFFLSLGNFRPLGRLIMVAVETMTLEAAMATGVPPHVLGGLTRLVMVGLMAASAAWVLSALYRSASAGHDDFSGRSGDAVLVPVLAASLVVSGLHGIMWFPVFLVGVVALALATPVFVVSHASLSRPWSWRRTSDAVELLTPALVGCALALIYDLAYVVPLLCLVMLVLRGRLARLTWKQISGSAAAARLLALVTGFTAVFVPVRLAIRARCSVADCYWATDVVPADFTISKTLERLVSGFPAAGWRHTMELLDHGPARFADYLSNWTTYLILGLLAVVTVRALSGGLRPLFERSRNPHIRVGMSLIVMGGATALLPSVMVGFSKTVQNSDWPIGTPWRETLMVQVGWALLLSGLLFVAVSWAGSRLGPRSGKWLAALVALGLLCAMVLTYYVNGEYARLLRSRPEESAVALVSASVVNFDTSEAGERARCEVLRSYPRTDRFGVLDMLNELTEDTYGQPFCDPATVGGYPSGFVDDDGSPHEVAIDAMHAASIIRGCADDPYRFCPDYKASKSYAIGLFTRLVWVDILEAGAADLLGKGSGGDLTRGELARFLVRSSEALRPVGTPRGLFGDVEDDLAPYAEAVYRARIVEPCEETSLRFCPEDTLTRGELVTIVARTFGIVDTPQTNNG